MINNVFIARFAYAIARGDADDVPCVNRYEDNDKMLYDTGGILDVVVPPLSECVVSVNTCVKSGLKNRNSKSGRRETLASMGLQVALAITGRGKGTIRSLVFKQFSRWVYRLRGQCTIGSQRRDQRPHRLRERRYRIV